LVTLLLAGCSSAAPVSSSDYLAKIKLHPEKSPTIFGTITLPLKKH